MNKWNALYKYHYAPFGGPGDSDEVRMRQKRLERRIGKSRQGAGCQVEVPCRTGVTTPRRARKKAEEVEEKLNSIGLDATKAS